MYEEIFYCTWSKDCPYRDEDGHCTYSQPYHYICDYATQNPPQKVDEEIFMDGEEVEAPTHFDRPTEVTFYDDEERRFKLRGIAYHDEVICLCCGGVYELDEVEIVEMFGGDNEEKEEWQPL